MRQNISGDGTGGARTWRSPAFMTGGHRAAFLISLCLALPLCAAAFMEKQSAQLESLLRDDFRLFLIVDDKAPLSAMNGLEDAVRALPYVAEARFVSKKQALEELKLGDADLIKSITVAAENPMPEYFSVKVADPALENIGGWLDANVLQGKMPAIAGVSYKPEQVYAILHASFYRRFLRLVFCAAAFVLAMAALAVEIAAVRGAGFSLPSVQVWGWLLSGAGGAAAGALLCWLLVSPVKHLSPMWWSLPLAQWRFAAPALGALCGWILFRWKETL
ncbi:MAG: permease-like cell division protein FtsX [Elusimicrobiales bacterium]